MIRPGPQSGPTFIPARSDLIRRGLAIRSDADWRSGPTIIPAWGFFFRWLGLINHLCINYHFGASFVIVQS
jgi:hypothetical protein